MTSNATVLERAFALAQSGEYAGIPQIRAQLRAEGYTTHQLEGPLLMKQIRALCTAARAAACA